MGLSGYRGAGMSYAGVNSEEVLYEISGRLKFLNEEVDFYSGHIEELIKERDMISHLLN